MLLERQFYTGDINLNYAEGPDNGLPLVLLHGGSGRWQMYRNELEEFALQWHVYAPDLRGHGKSDHAPDVYRMSDFADDIVAFLNQLSEPAVLIGHSLGGQVGLMAAAQAPDRVRCLIIGDSPFSNQNLIEMFEREHDKLETWMNLCGRPIAEIAEALKDMPLLHGGNPEPRPAREIFGEDSLFFPDFAANLHTHDANFLRALLEDFEQLNAAYQVDQLLPRIPCPTLILQADPERGGLMTQEEIDLGLQLLPDGHHVCLDGIGHGLFFEDRPRVMSVILDFLREIRKDEI